MVSYPVKVWKLVPNVDENRIVVYIWGKEEMLEEYLFFIDEFLESIQISGKGKK